MTKIAYLEDAEFDAYRERVRKHVLEIRIGVDISPGIAKVVLAKLDEAYSWVRLDLAELKSEVTRLESLIKEVERINSTGPNETMRKLNATESVQNYEVNGIELNLYQVYRQVNERYEFVDGVKDLLFQKQARLITASGLLKLEKELMPHG